MALTMLLILLAFFKKLKGKKNSKKENKCKVIYLRPGFQSAQIHKTAATILASSSIKLLQSSSVSVLPSTSNQVLF